MQWPRKLRLTLRLSPQPLQILRRPYSCLFLSNYVCPYLSVCHPACLPVCLFCVCACVWRPRTLLWPRRFQVMRLTTVINQLTVSPALRLPFFLRVWVLLQPLRLRVRILELVGLLSWPSWATAPSSPVPSSDILLNAHPHPPDHPGSGDSCSKETLVNKAQVLSSGALGAWCQLALGNEVGGRCCPQTDAQAAPAPRGHLKWTKFLKG